MSIQITIIGLGQVGSSIGLALAPHKNLKRVGHDKDMEVARAAQKAGAVDETNINLPASVRDANIVLLCIPLSEMRETLDIIAPDLQEGTVIMDTAPAKATVAAWVKELVPQGRHYVGLSPAVGAGHLHDLGFGVESARADLFHNGLFLINALPGTPEEAVKLALDLIELLGAKGLLSDSMEADGLLASTHILPQLIAAALLDATLDQPGWKEAGRLAARPYATASAAFTFHDDAASLSEAVLANRENVVRVLDAYMASLKELRDGIAEGDRTSVSTYLDDTMQAHARWLRDRSVVDWQGIDKDKAEIPAIGERLNQMFFGGLATRSKKNK